MNDRSTGVGEFAQLGGVTIKALRHYERLNLLVAARTPKGQRLYSLLHLQRLQCIVALKQVRVPLSRMRRLLDAPPQVLKSELRGRWNQLAERLWCTVPADRGLQRELHEGFARAWRDRNNWPVTLQRRFEEYGVSRVAMLVGQLSQAH